MNLESPEFFGLGWFLGTLRVYAPKDPAFGLPSEVKMYNHVSYWKRVQLAVPVDDEVVSL